MADIYTDGSVCPNPGRGVSGAIRGQEHLTMQMENVTSNTAELVGIYLGAVIATTGDTINTDSFVAKSWLNKKGAAKNCKENTILAITKQLIAYKRLKIKQIPRIENLCHDVVECAFSNTHLPKGDMADRIKTSRPKRNTEETKPDDTRRAHPRHTAPFFGAAILSSSPLYTSNPKDTMETSDSSGLTGIGEQGKMPGKTQREEEGAVGSSTAVAG